MHDVLYFFYTVLLCEVYALCTSYRKCVFASVHLPEIIEIGTMLFIYFQIYNENDFFISFNFKLFFFINILLISINSLFISKNNNKMSLLEVMLILLQLLPLFKKKTIEYLY